MLNMLNSRVETVITENTMDAIFLPNEVIPSCTDLKFARCAGFSVKYITV
jgi:hypothetical protein